MGFLSRSFGQAALLALLGPNLALADAYRIPQQSAVAAGQAEAYSAQADDASALFYNPAGLAQVHGFQVSLGTNFVGGSIDYTSPTGLKATGDFGKGIASPLPSNAYFTANLQDLGIDALGPLTVGLGLATPYGLVARYPDPTPFSPVVTRAKLPMLDIRPTLAYRVADWLSVGLGADIYTFADFLGSGGYEQQAKVPGLGQTELSANGTIAGYNASLLFTPLRTAEGKPRLNLGFVFRSGGNFPLSGQYKVNGIALAKIQTALELPDVYTAAVAYWPVRDLKHEWKLEYDMDFVRWNSFHALDIQFSNGGWLRIPENWTGAYTIGVGTEFKWLDLDFLPGWNVALRAGYHRSETPIPNNTFSPAIPENTWNALAFGVGAVCHKGGRFLGLWDCGAGGGWVPQSFGVDLAFQAEFFEPRKVGYNVNPGVSGTYNTVLYIGSLNISLAY